MNKRPFKSLISSHRLDESPVQISVRALGPCGFLVLACVAIAPSIASGGEFGFNAVFAGEVKDLAMKQIATQVTLSGPVTLQSISCYINGPPPKNIRLAVYSDNGGEPGALIAETGVTSTLVSGFGWHTIATTPTPLLPGTYWLAMGFDHKNVKYNFNPGSGKTRYTNHDAIGSGFLATWGASTDPGARQVAIYATYTLAPPYMDVTTLRTFGVTTSTSASSGSASHWGDLDGDGDLDAILTGNSARLMINNNAGGSFTASSFGSGNHARQGALVDIDNDGDLDFWTSSDKIYLNNGSGVFSDGGNLGFSNASNSGGMAAADVNNDGGCDIVIFATNGNWLGQHQLTVPTTLAGTKDASYGLNGGGDVGNGNYVSMGDVNNDGYPDFFYHYDGGRLFLSNGDGTYTQNASGISVANASGDEVGSAWADYDNDGDLDLFVPRYAAGQPGYLWRNDGGVFTNVATALGIADTSGQRTASWGDYDNDGDLDLYIVTHSGASNKLYRNLGGPGFGFQEANDVLPASGAAAPGNGHDGVFMDYDNDGSLDIAVMQQSANAVLLWNTLDNTNYLKVRVIGRGARGTNRAGVGVRVELWDAANTTYLGRREVGVARGFGGAEPMWVHFGGVTNLTTYTVRVYFSFRDVSNPFVQTVVPAAASTTIGATTVAQTLTIIEPEIKVVRWAELIRGPA